MALERNWFGCGLWARGHLRSWNPFTNSFSFICSFHHLCLSYFMREKTSQRLNFIIIFFNLITVLISLSFVLASLIKDGIGGGCVMGPQWNPINGSVWGRSKQIKIKFNFILICEWSRIHSIPQLSISSAAAPSLFFFFVKEKRRREWIAEEMELSEFH